MAKHLASWPRKKRSRYAPDNLIILFVMHSSGAYVRKQRAQKDNARPLLIELCFY
jgi:hypothetical protein